MCRQPMSIFIEQNGEESQAHPCRLIEPKQLALLSNRIAISIVKELADHPAAAADIAKKLKQNEQKIYYHLRKLLQAGIVEVIGSERRHGLLANIYTANTPIVGTRLFAAEGTSIPRIRSEPHLTAFFSPFVEKGRLNATLVVGASGPHGTYGKGAYDGVYATDLMCLLGALAPEQTFPCYHFDTEMKETDLRENLIIIGSPLVNTITERINPLLPLHFLPEQGMAIRSKATKRIYDDYSTGMVVKMRNPFNPDRFILVLAGRRSAGTIAAINAVTRQLTDLNYNPREGTLARLVLGHDRDSDGRVDHVAVIE